MAELNRVVMTPGLFRISREGFDAINPPTTTSEHLVIDSSWPKVERLHAVLFSPAPTNLLEGNPRVMNFTPLPEAPLALMLTRDATLPRIYDTQSHESTYRFSPAMGDWVDVQEDTHFIKSIGLGRVVLTQKIKRDLKEDGDSTFPIKDLRKFVFIVLVFKP